MDLVTIILSCAFVSIDDSLIVSTAMRESGGSPYHVRARGRAEGIDYKDEPRALAAIERVVAHSKGAYIGLMGVPNNVAAEYELTAKQLLEPCNNIKVATAMLADFKAHCETEEASDVTGCALSKYGKATGNEADYFAEDVILGAIAKTEPDDDSTDAERVSEDILFKNNAPIKDGQSIFFDLDMDNITRHSKTKIAEELE